MILVIQMAYDIILGRDAADKKKFGRRGLINLGKGYVKMGNYTSLSNKLWMDVARSHVVLIAGKRGSGKSYSIGVIAEELAHLDSETARNIASLIFDTMGIFWTMKYKNDKEKELLDEWGLESKELPVRVFVPYGRANDYQEKSIPYDGVFALNPVELEADDWATTFGISMTSPEGALIAQALNTLKTKQDYTFHDIIKAVEHEPHTTNETKYIVLSLFKAAESWGIFAESRGTNVLDLIKAGQTTILDTSTYNSLGSFNVRALVIGLVSKKLFKSRMDARKKEEIESLQHGKGYLEYGTRREMPLVWIFVDEAHEFLPKDGNTSATDALVQILREGRQPGISLVLATQQPGQIHRDVMTQSDIVIAHKVTSQQDIEALNQIMQTYLLETIRKNMEALPAQKGAAIVLDDNSERIYSIRVRPRSTWHGGEAPVAIKSDISLI